MAIFLRKQRGHHFLSLKPRDIDMRYVLKGDIGFILSAIANMGISSLETNEGVAVDMDLSKLTSLCKAAQEKISAITNERGEIVNEPTLVP